MSRRSGRRGTRSSGTGYGRTVALVAAILAAASGVGALILLLLRRAREAEPVPVDTTPEPAEVEVEEVVVIPASEPQQKPADYSIDQPLDGEDSAAEDQEAGGLGVAEEDHAAEDRERTVREFVDRLNEEPPAGQVAEAEAEAKAESQPSTEEPAGIVEEPTPEGRETIQEAPEEDAAERADAEHADAERADEGLADDRMTVVGVLARMGEAYREAGGSRFVLSSEDEGNFDLYGREEDLDEVYERQVSARVTGRILDENSQPRTFEVTEVEPA